jgi:uncharacterized protein (TIGR02266 family)
MMTNDGRRDQRRAIALQIRFKSATLNEFIAKYSRDLSKGGFFIKTTSPMPSGTLIKFDVQTEELNSLIQGVGRVVWRRLEDADEDSPAGMGVKFIKLDETSRTNLGVILESKESVEQGEEEVEAPVVEMKEAVPSQPPKLIVPVRPQAVPKDAKRTMLGIGRSSSIPPVAKETESLAPETTEEVATGSFDKEISEEITAATLDREISEEFTAPTLAQEISVETNTYNFAQDLSKEETAAPSLAGEASEVTGAHGLDEDSRTELPRETNILADITTAIDSSLDTAPGTVDVEEQEGVDPAAEEQAEEQGRIADSAEEMKPTKPSSAPPQVVSTRAPAKPEPKGISKTVWILLVVIIAVAAWYIARPSEEKSPQERVSTQPKEPVKSEKAASTAPGQVEDKEQEPVKVVTIEVKTDPTEAKVSVNGDVKEGVTPLVLDNIKVGEETEIKVQRFGYATRVEKVVPSEDPMELELALVQIPVTAQFTSNPKGAAVEIDGERVGNTPFSQTKIKEFGPGFSYTIKKNGYQKLSGDVTEESWEEQGAEFVTHVDVTLNKAIKQVPAKRASWKERIKNWPKAEAEPKPEPEPEPKAEPKPEPEPEPKAEPKPKPAPKAEPKPKPAPVQNIDENPF